jgi:hypothetical protein
MAGNVISSAPVLLVFAVAQKHLASSVFALLSKADVRRCSKSPRKGHLGFGAGRGPCSSRARTTTEKPYSPNPCCRKLRVGEGPGPEPRCPVRAIDEEELPRDRLLRRCADVELGEKEAVYIGELLDDLALGLACPVAGLGLDTQ